MEDNMNKYIQNKYDWIDGVEIRQYGPSKKSDSVAIAVFYKDEYKGSQLFFDDESIIKWFDKVIIKNKAWNNLLN